MQLPVSDHKVTIFRPVQGERTKVEGYHGRGRDVSPNPVELTSKGGMGEFQRSKSSGAQIENRGMGLGDGWSNLCLLRLGFVEKLIDWAVKVSTVLKLSERHVLRRNLGPFVVFDWCRPWKLTHTEAPESADAGVILFLRSDIPLPPMSAQSAGLQAVGESPQSKTSTIYTNPPFSIAQPPQSKPVTWKRAQMVSIRVIKMWMNPFVFRDFLWPPPHHCYPCPEYSRLPVSACVFLFAAFGLMSPHSVTVLMESKC